MRTQDEIVGRIKQRGPSDPLGFEVDELYPYLDFAHAREFLKADTTDAEWEEARGHATPSQRIRDYMAFAWEKANNCRGISAGRSVAHMAAWLWLDEKDELANKMESEYEYYGKPCLVLICQEYGVDWRTLDNGRWANDENGFGLSADEALRTHGIEAESQG